MASDFEILKRTADSYRKIRNTARYFLSNLDGFNQAEHEVPYADMLELDKWALARAAALQEALKKHYEKYQFHQIYQKLHNFCVVEMSNFYLDIIKDRLYTMKVDSLARRSAQTAQYHIIQALTRWIAPILSFTADEIWQFIPGNKAGSVFTAEWYSFPEINDAGVFNNAWWQEIAKIKTAVNKAIEQKRKDGSVGGSLTTKVSLFCSDEVKNRLAQLKDELRFVLICSEVNLLALGDEGDATEIEGLRVSIEKSDAEKCVRCWHYRADVGQAKVHPELCGRCVENVEGSGETREFV